MKGGSLEKLKKKVRTEKKKKKSLDLVIRQSWMTCFYQMTLENKIFIQRGPVERQNSLPDITCSLRLQ